ncbi:MAG: peptidoglycan-binding domain-containing protein [Planctomycetota bacterium]
MRFLLLATTLALLATRPAQAVDFQFYGRSGDAIELDFGALPGTSSGAIYTAVSLDSSSSGHTALTSTQLGQGGFSLDGRLWVFANPARNTPSLGDTDPDARGFQGRIEGSITVNGQPRTFAVNVVPGYTGAGPGAVMQDIECRTCANNNELHVAQQQQRLRYLGFRQSSGNALPSVDGNFGINTESALKTFQAAFLSGGNVNATQNNADGVVGPNTAGWLNAANAPTWDELFDPDPQSGFFSVGNMIGDFDILPSCDPGTGCRRSGATPQVERWGTDWTIDLFEEGSALAKQRTNITQLMNGMSTLDGYESAAFHSTHRAGMDIDIHVDQSAQQVGNGVINAAEQGVIDTAVAFIDAGAAGGPERGSLARFITSNSDIRNGILAQRPGTSLFLDTGGGHFNHLHIDVAPPAQVAGIANLAGDFNLDGRVDLADYTVWRDGRFVTFLDDQYATWAGNFGADQAAAVAVPEPGAAALLVLLIVGGQPLATAARSPQISAAAKR